jgi:FtsH-binding integral membrane protein
VLVFLAAGPLAISLGLASEIGHNGALFAMFATGLVFYVFSAGLSSAARRRRMDDRLAYAAALLNAAWVVGSVGFLLIPLAMSAEATLAVMLVAVVAAAFAALEGYGIWKARGTLASGEQAST